MVKRTVKRDREAKVLLIEYANSVLQLVQAANARNVKDSLGMVKANLHTLERDVRRFSDR